MGSIITLVDIKLQANKYFILTEKKSKMVYTMGPVFPVQVEFFQPSQCKPREECKPRKNRQPNRVCICLKKVKPENLKLQLNKKGILTINAQKEETVDTNRNGQRKTTTIIQETFELPKYVVENDWLEKVETGFDEGCLFVSWPEKSTAVNIPVVFEDMEVETEEKSKSIEK